MTKKEKKAYVGRIDCYVDTFESLKHIDKNGNEFWYARDLQPNFGYKDWRNFKKVITKAKNQIKKNKKDPSRWIVEVNKPIISGKGREQNIIDYVLTRYGAYAVAVNTDPSKEEAAIAKEYFVVQTRNAEVIYKRLKDAHLLYCRDQLKHANKELAFVLKHDADIDNIGIGIVMSNGDEGMHGMSTKSLKKKHGIKETDPLADYMSSELLLSKTLAQMYTTSEIKRKKVKGVKAASKVAYDNNKEMRDKFIEKFGEDPESHIGKENIKKIKKDYKDITDEFISKFE